MGLKSSLQRFAVWGQQQRDHRTFFYDYKGKLFEMRETLFGAAKGEALASKKAGPMQLVDWATCIVGMYLFFLLYGLCQEEIFQLQLPGGSEMFTYSNFLIFCLCLSNMLSSAAILNYFSATKQAKLPSENAIPKQFLANTKFIQLFHILPRMTKKAVMWYILASMTYILSMACTNYALTQVNYPTQVLVKSGKLVLVVTGGFIVFGKRYPWFDYVSVIVVTASLICFNLFGSISHHHHTTAGPSPELKGILLLVTSLICDGLTGPIQDHVVANYEKFKQLSTSHDLKSAEASLFIEERLSPVQLMFCMNLFGCIWSFLCTFFIDGFSAPLHFVFYAPSAAGWLLLFFLSGTLGQFFLFRSLDLFGSLYTTFFTTLRKAASTMLSVYLFGHTLTYVQKISVFAVFVTLMAQSYLSNLYGKKKAKKY